MKKIILILITILIIGCSITALLPEACVTIKVVDEEGKPIQNVPVGVGFERNTGSGVTSNAVNGITNSDGGFTARGKTTNYVFYRVDLPGYYASSGKYKFEREVAKKWRPWNPEIKLVLRKIEKPVPMYARNTHESKHIELPVNGKKIGFDLIAYDWVKPYGNGEHADFIFKLDKQFTDDNNYDAKLSLSFSKNTDGITTIDEDIYSSSEFKLPRYAPEEGYKNNIIYHEKRQSGQILESTENLGRNYIFRIRSINKDGHETQAMYGKIQGEIRFEPRGRKTAVILFKYYLNPDYTTNLEFDPKRNLFSDLKSFEQVGL